MPLMLKAPYEWNRAPNSKVNCQIVVNWRVRRVRASPREALNVTITDQRPRAPTFYFLSWLLLLYQYKIVYKQRMLRARPSLLTNWMIFQSSSNPKRSFVLRKWNFGHEFLKKKAYFLKRSELLWKFIKTSKKFPQICEQKIGRCPLIHGAVLEFLED